MEVSRLMTADEVADMLQVPKGWVYEQSRRGTIPTVTLGGIKRKTAVLRPVTCGTTCRSTEWGSRRPDR